MRANQTIVALLYSRGLLTLDQRCLRQVTVCLCRAAMCAWSSPINNFIAAYSCLPGEPERERKRKEGVFRQPSSSRSLSLISSEFSFRGRTGAPTPRSNRILPLFRENVDQKGCQHKTGCSTSSSRGCVQFLPPPPPSWNFYTQAEAT